MLDEDSKVTKKKVEFNMATHLPPPSFSTLNIAHTCVYVHCQKLMPSDFCSVCGINPMKPHEFLSSHYKYRAGARQLINMPSNASKSSNKKCLNMHQVAPRVPLNTSLGNPFNPTEVFGGTPGVI